MNMSREFHIRKKLFDSTQLMAFPFLLASVLIFSSCKNNSVGHHNAYIPNHSTPQGAKLKHLQNAEVVIDTISSLPSVTNLSSCSLSSSAKTPKSCAWYFSTDAIVWGVIEQVQAVESPSLLTTSPTEYELLDKCDGAVNPALEIIVNVERTIRGGIHDRVTARVGARQLYTFNPRPRLEHNGETAWVSMGRSSGRALFVGQPIGLALHYNAEHNVWSVMGEQLFTTVYDNGKNVIAFQQTHGVCGILPPYELEGLTLDEIAHTLENCSESEWAEASNDRRRNILNSWGSRPEQFMAAVCMPGHWFKERENGTCSIDSDCNVNEHCQNDRCARL